MRFPSYPDMAIALEQDKSGVIKLHDLALRLLLCSIKEHLLNALCFLDLGVLHWCHTGVRSGMTPRIIREDQTKWWRKPQSDYTQERSPAPGWPKRQHQGCQDGQRGSIKVEQ